MGAAAAGAAMNIPTARLHYLASRIHGLGPAPLAYLLAELVEGADPLSRAEAYARLAPLAGFIAGLGGHRLPGLRVVNGGRP
jgi:hypothetical protein